MAALAAARETGNPPLPHPLPHAQRPRGPPRPSRGGHSAPFSRAAGKPRRPLAQRPRPARAAPLYPGPFGPRAGREARRRGRQAEGRDRGLSPAPAPGPSAVSVPYRRRRAGAQARRDRGRCQEGLARRPPHPALRTFSLQRSPALSYGPWVWEARIGLSREAEPRPSFWRGGSWRSIHPPATARFCTRDPNCRLLLLSLKREA